MPRKTSFDQALKTVKSKLKKAPNSDFQILSSEDKQTIILLNPWNDKSLALIVYEDGQLHKDILEIIEKVTLPPDLSAIYHKDNKSLEIIWTAYKLPEEIEDIKGRNFEFEHCGKVYNCSFEESSAQLLALASKMIFLQISDTSFRNLQSYKHFHNKDKINVQVKQKIGEPISFFINGIHDIDDQSIELIKNINFYLKYYDRRSPIVKLHNNSEKQKFPPKRYVENIFPSSISSRELNPTLLSFWNAAYNLDYTTKFLLYYRILEFVSGSYLQASQRQELLKVLASPTARSSIDQTLDRVAEIVRQEKMNDFDRYEKMFIDLVDRSKICQEIDQHSDFFTSPCEFDGGLKIDALIKKLPASEDFDVNKMKSLASSLRKVRHALAHGGEQQAGNLVLPTHRNSELLMPWTNVAMVAAGEAIVYEHLA